MNILPFSLHIPGYRYCGPGTKLNKDESQDPNPINRVDAICKSHDYDYKAARTKDDIRQADCKMIHRLNNSKDLNLNEKIGKLISKGGIQTKIALGSGSRRRKRNR